MSGSSEAAIEAVSPSVRFTPSTIAGRDRTSFTVIEIQGYTDLEVIGRGGFAVVYKARQVSVGRDVAIKLLTDPAPDDDLVRRFQRESQAVGALSWHPHIAAVVDAGSTAQGQAYITFELLPGGSLEERIEHAPLPWNEAVAAIIQVADAVEAAHRADVLHRDIKPANILLDRLGVAKLGDFGIASMQDGNKTETGMLATTVAHAAPELFDGQPASAATDVYALGSTLHTLVAGRPPFVPGTDERIATTISRIMSEPPPRLDPTQVPGALSTVIAHALAKQPQYRPRSAGGFGQALQQVQRDHGVAVTAMPVTDSEPSPGPAAVPTPRTQPAAAGDGAEVRLGSDPKRTLPAQPQPATNGSETRHVPFVPPTEAAAPASDTNPFGRTITVLSIIAALLAISVGAIALYQSQRVTHPQTVTAGGASILTYAALLETEMASPFDAAKALDKDETTQWGIEPNANGTRIGGSSYVITLSEEQRIVRVGIVNADSTELGRVTGIQWGTGFTDEDRPQLDGPIVAQELPNAPGPFMVDYDVTTDQIVLTLAGVHDNAPNAGIAEILIEVEETSTAE